MFTTIQPHEYSRNVNVLISIFKLRKQVFLDQLNWNVPVDGDLEYDNYDCENASHLIWCSEDRKILYGCIRLLPTDGPTLLHDVFAATHGGSKLPKSGKVWEGTRMCINEAALARDFSDIDPKCAVNMLLLALCEAALFHGIKQMISNFEPAMSRVYRRAGLVCQLHGQADGYGARPVCCASFEVSGEILSRMRSVLAIDVPLFRASPTTTKLVNSEVNEALPVQHRSTSRPRIVREATDAVAVVPLHPVA